MRYLVTVPVSINKAVITYEVYADSAAEALKNLKNGDYGKEVGHSLDVEEHHYEDAKVEESSQ